MMHIGIITVMLALVLPLTSMAFATMPRAPISFRRLVQSVSATKTDETSGSVSRRAALLGAAILASGTAPAHGLSYEGLEELVAKYDKTLAARNNNGAPEKHLPTLTVGEVTGNSGKIVPGFVKVVVSVNHVMDSEKPHYIQYMWLRDDKTGEVLSVKDFKATDESPPTLTVVSHQIIGKTVTPFIFCNLHGLWEGKPIKINAA